jgi:hypothetical protein
VAYLRCEQMFTFQLDYSFIGKDTCTLEDRAI